LQHRTTKHYELPSPKEIVGDIFEEIINIGEVLASNRLSIIED
jgi:hypothetical protein